MIGMDSSFGRSGSHDWRMQRYSAYYLLIYFGYLLFSVFNLQTFDYLNWSAIFSPQWMQLATTLAVTAVSIHAWAGLWIVSTDYLKPVVLRNGFQLLVLLTCVGFILYTINIFWG